MSLWTCKLVEFCSLIHTNDCFSSLSVDIWIPLTFIPITGNYCRSLSGCYHMVFKTTHTVYIYISLCLFVWWCLTPLSTIFRLYHIMLYTLSWSSFELTTSVVMGTNCIGSCLSNYHTITTTMAPVMIIIKYCTKWWEQNYPPFPALILLKLYWTISFHCLIPVYGTLVIYGYGKCKLVC